MSIAEPTKEMSKVGSTDWALLMTPLVESAGNMETVKHIALICANGEEIGRSWSSWEEMDEKKK